MKGKIWLIVSLVLIVCTFVFAGEEDEKISSSTFSGLKFRCIGPAYASGRIADFAVNPANPSEYYVGVASGHIWKTVNQGITFEPVFDKHHVYAIGCLAMNPGNHNVVWAGTGENNSQRALGYGNGVYKTVDAGKSWINMGLKSSRQIGKILIDPRNTDIVYVACEGSVWGPGGERGLYKTTDGGKTWKAVLTISEDTGVSDMVMDLRDPDVIYAASHQRRRHVFTKIDGGPETAIYKTTDGGQTWDTLKTGLPSVDMGAIGLAISPVNPDYIYAIIEAADESEGFYRSIDRGMTWKKMSSYVAGSPQYYNEIFCDPGDVDKIYSMDTYSKVTVDGGKTWEGIGLKERHVDDHALWINPHDTNHLLIGGDGGIYESYDSGENWRHIPNLPITQFYRVAVDNSKPFYYVYGGTQDNNSMGGPSRTICSKGILNSDWFITNGGDGFWSAIDPENPNIVYAEAQYGYMVRYDKQSGESISIKPQPRKDEYTYRWNWDTPLFISPHSHTRIYCAANKVFRSEDRGNTWKVISEDLTRQLDRNKLEVMGRVWSCDAVAKNESTSLFGTIISMAESEVLEDLLYAGTDDGLIQVTEDGGKNWRKIEKFPGVPEMTYVNDICPSKFDAQVVFACFNNKKRDDFNPYILKSNDKGKSWKSIANNLPDNESVLTIAQDHENPDLLFVGTEFGVYFSYNGGEKWIELKSGIPDIAVKDIAIQERENDLVLATFGRSFYILDDYTPLRLFTDELFEKEAHLFPIQDALIYIPSRGKYGQGSTYYAAENPEVGATFTYYIKEAPKTLCKQRKEKEKELRNEGKPIPYPTWEELRAEENEEKPYLLFTIYDKDGSEVRTLSASPSEGVHRITWDFRTTSTRPLQDVDEYNPLEKAGDGYLIMPGTYKVSLSLCLQGKLSKLLEPVEFEVVPLYNTTLPAEDRGVLVAFQKKAADLYRIVQGSFEASEELAQKLETIKQAIHNTPSTGKLMSKAKDMERKLQKILLVFNGDPIIRKYDENPPTSLSNRLRTLVYTHHSSTCAVTQTEKDAYKIIKEEFTKHYNLLQALLKTDLVELEKQMDEAGVPWTSGRLPEWNE